MGLTVRALYGWHSSPVTDRHTRLKDCLPKRCWQVSNSRLEYLFYGWRTRWRILEIARDIPLPSNFFHFHSFRQKPCQIITFCLRLSGWRPLSPVWKILDLPLFPPLGNPGSATALGTLYLFPTEMKAHIVYFDKSRIVLNGISKQQHSNFL